MKYYAVERIGDHLEHYGVKGMRWGIRKQQSVLVNRKHPSYNYQKAEDKLKTIQNKKPIKAETKKSGHAFSSKDKELIQGLKASIKRYRFFGKAGKVAGAALHIGTHLKDYRALRKRAKNATGKSYIDLYRGR